MSILLACPPDGSLNPAELAKSFGPILIGVLTVWVALRQLRQNRDDTAKQRALETKRGVLLGGVRALAKLSKAMANVANPNASMEAASNSFNEAIAEWIAASAVASIEVVERGRDYIGELAPKFIELLIERQKLEAKMGDKIQNWNYGPLSAQVLNLSMELNKMQLRTISAVRHDIGIEDATDEQFIAAAEPNAAKIREVLGLFEG